mmetsp:Transcript_4059/g.7111  ORF Transcript_4059/g.7111 Transcript_4059/m.7111 type:complete len:889 (-) Transcript_4059:1473-4139(-)|eukprot:CAMPEP_0182446196 /NCGR_PEP_ID=MMETSP1172-20130603/4048_1 /TAXON_ID=708627 /ORGANISM="Timspurckia oligopyrenoides, Strain CCMP3278" /LENGTH=888 /DNA_ID=CAMNT_0024642089 /DNA_START=204 /DNA_END=2870 /DNA_ORIENTATION=+
MAEVGISRKGSADSVESLEGKMKVTAVTPAVAVQQSTPVLRDNYSTDGNLIKSRQNVIAALASDMREGGLGFQHVESEVDEVDVNTPDNWVPRSKHLIRLTGKHPFNCEPKIGILLDQGFFTPPSIHYIRNHGLALKEIEWESHSVSIGGLVANPLTLSMNELEAMPATSLPVTLVCAGNRRKEQNMTKQTIGFSWGPCAVGTHIWTGVRLRDLLLRAGIDMSRAKHVCFVGAEDLPNGKYGTSIPISLAMDAFGEVLIAYENNGMRLTPDHGYPVRVVIPGWIGGRMVKWLKDIIVTEEPSDNFYHFFDNRIMPPHVDAELAKKEGWWYKPEYLFNELNINSAIGSPDHDERLSLTSPNQEYTMRGYAYSGGGRKITRVEVSFDGGRVWELCNVDRPEEKFSHTTQYGRYYCWAFWTYKVQTKRFLETAMGSGELLCRAWDESNNTQPANLTWNLMGMGNNPHFRVKIHPETSLAGEFRLRFEHPTVAGPAKGGWMNPLDSEELAVNAESAKVTSAAATAAPTAKKVKDPSKKYFTWDEIKKHDNDDSAWIVVRDQVYDCTPFLKDHPGGGASITMNAGMDSTEDFDAIHSSKAQKMLEDYYIGELDENGDMSDESTSMEEAKVLIALNPKEKIKCPLIEKESVSYNTRRLRFALPTPEHILGLPIGYHMMISGKVNGKLVMRAYTPTSTNENVGYFELVIKVYFKNEHPKFPDGGVFSQFLDSLTIGDSVEVKGPLGHFEYARHGNIILHGKKQHVKKLGFICGGTGITPAYQVIKQILKDESDTTEVYLLYANQTPSDVLLGDELNAWAAKHKNFHLWYTVDRVPEGVSWKYSTGFIDEQMLRERMPSNSEDTFVGMCGPPPMIKFACIPNLEKLGFVEPRHFTF